jgi:hypothetical protein
VERGKAFLLYGDDKTRLSQKRVNAKQRGVVSVDNQVELAEYEVLSDFKAWNDSINSHFPELHEENTLPKPIRNVSNIVFEFAQKFGNMYGEWLWHDLYGYVWRPYLNDQRYPWGTWQPYINGSWANRGGEMFWVPAEPWGWVPYHLGIWMWDKSKGWVWLPGSLFAPAWAVWDFYSGMYCWRPYYLYDWMFGFESFWSPFSWSAYYGPNYPSGRDIPFPRPPQDIIHNIRKDQLKKSDSPSLPMPKEMKKALEATLAALKRGDQAVLNSLESLPRYSVIVKKQDFLSSRWQEKIIPFERLARVIEAVPQAVRPPSSRRSADVSRDALLTIERSRIMADLKAQPALSPEHAQMKAPAPGEISFQREAAAGKREAAAPPSFRFRDWNPDIGAAIRLGVEISYSSRTNEVTCPRLGLSSRQIRPAMRTMMQAPSGSSPARGSSSSSGQASVSGSPSRSAGHSQPSRSSGSQKQKN